MLTAPLRTIPLTSHVATSVGWLGAVVAFLALSVAAVLGSELSTTRGTYFAMNLCHQGTRPLVTTVMTVVRTPRLFLPVGKATSPAMARAGHTTTPV